ncbi:hypothetical protein GCM10010210_24610 [Pseudonocardia hydrocarbonoxydans]|uniref:Uncharacterized protein n=1 Tax=Pseudonocardia hydrocarbonoxydans TaxID=76726 RepID=A0A4Y3WKQ2_9PSEU|nr:hypothetical protein PHY01_18200 [Pseudonocardia hydrocarbonoxydans]
MALQDPDDPDPRSREAAQRRTEVTQGRSGHAAQGSHFRRRPPGPRSAGAAEAIGIVAKIVCRAGNPVPAPDVETGEPPIPEDRNHGPVR